MNSLIGARRVAPYHYWTDFTNNEDAEIVSDRNDGNNKDIA